MRILRHPFWLVVRNVHYEDVQVLVILLKQVLYVFGFVIWADDVEEPLHRADDPAAIDLFDLVLVNAFEVVYGVLQTSDGRLLHGLRFFLSIFVA